MCSVAWERLKADDSPPSSPSRRVLKCVAIDVVSSRCCLHLDSESVQGDRGRHQIGQQP